MLNVKEISTIIVNKGKSLKLMHQPTNHVWRFQFGEGWAFRNPAIPKHRCPEAFPLRKSALLNPIPEMGYGQG